MQSESPGRQILIVIPQMTLIINLQCDILEFSNIIMH